VQNGHKEKTIEISMIEKRTPNQFFPIVLVLFLGACGKQSVVSPTETPIPTAVSPTIVPTSTLIPILFTPSSLPTRPTIPIITPDSIQLERWIEYEDALKQRILPTWSFESLHCEWDILARAGQEVYVWALCGSSKGTDMRPAVIHLRANGSIRSVEILRLGHLSDIDRLFPKEARAKFSFYQGRSAFDGRLKEMLDHLYYRETHPEEPPLVILSVIPTATPTP
jgi:hypothetical protein